MTKIFNRNSHFSSSISNSIIRTAKPSSEFYSIFSEAEVLEIIHALEVRREVPLKYSYKGRGAKIWNAYYLKYIIPRWYRSLSLEIDFLNKNFEYINDKLQSCEKINVIDVGAGNSYPVKQFIYRLHEIGRVNKYIALDISDDLLKLSEKNFRKWFPSIQFISYALDIENSCIPEILLKQATLEPNNVANIILHLGVTMGNHHNRIGVLKNLRNSMTKNDLLVFTSETGSNSKWDGTVRGGYKYHAEQVYKWIKNKIGIEAGDCELVRKYDLKTDSIVANMKFRHNYSINFNFKGINKNIEISKNEEITVWRHRKYEMPELLQDIEQAGLKLVHYSTDKYLSNIMVICQVASN